MARCTLDIDNPNFKASFSGNDAEFETGLMQLREKLANNHRAAEWVNHPMPKYRDYQNRIWKWDFRLEGERSSTRPGWRLYGYVENPEGPEPIRVTPFWYYEKPGPRGNHVPLIANALKKFLTSTVLQKSEDRFQRQIVDGFHRSWCLECFEAFGPYAEIVELEAYESTHECPKSELDTTSTPN